MRTFRLAAAPLVLLGLTLAPDAAGADLGTVTPTPLVRQQADTFVAQ